jgi:2-polyprenyl-3-methyl-5-hydroxy-6-metoxy-1,4-benzoquinol methylase
MWERHVETKTILSGRDKGVIMQEHLKYPADGWLRGYFTTDAVDVLGGARTENAYYKNEDFLRLRDTALHALDPAPGMKILDVGCAGGANMVYCGLQGAEVYGQDWSSDAVNEANEYLRRFNIRGEAVCGNAARLQFPDNYFDGAISGDFFEHITDAGKVRVLREMMRVVKPGGRMVIKTPNLSYLKLALSFKRLRAIARLQNPLKHVIAHTPGTDDPQHIGLVNRWRLRDCLLEAGIVNYRFFYAPLRRFGNSAIVETLSTEIPVVRDLLCEDVFCLAYKPISLTHFPG